MMTIPQPQDPPIRMTRWHERDGLSCWHLRGRARHGGSRWQTRVSGEVWLWLNRSGEGVIWGAQDRMYLRPGMYAIFGEESGDCWRWTRLPGSHEVEVVVFRREWLAGQTGDGASGNPRFAAWLEKGGKLAFSGLMTLAEHRLADDLARLAAGAAADEAVDSRVRHWAAVRLFRSGRHDSGGGFRVMSDE